MNYTIGQRVRINRSHQWGVVAHAGITQVRVECGAFQVDETTIPRWFWFTPDQLDKLQPALVEVPKVEMCKAIVLWIAPESVAA